jgi:hypothetical protein
MRPNFPDEKTTEKMEQSILNFRSTHPDWMPSNVNDDDTSAYINRVNDPLRSVNAFRMGVTHRRPSHPFLGFAASSQFSQTSRAEHSGTMPVHANRLDFMRSQTSTDNLRHMNIRSPGGLQATPPVLTRQRYEEEQEETLDDSEGENSFISPSQALEEELEENNPRDDGVLGLLQDMYRGTGTGKGIGL